MWVFDSVFIVELKLWLFKKTHIKNSNIRFEDEHGFLTIG